MSENEYLRKCVEEGKKHELALSVWRGFIENRREEIMKKFSEGDYSSLDDDMSELRLLKMYEDTCYVNMDRGNSAEEKLNRLKDAEEC